MGAPAWWHTVTEAFGVVMVLAGLAWDEMSIGSAMCGCL